jgi:carboxypeptidase C (cathepsin A)
VYFHTRPGIFSRGVQSGVMLRNVLTLLMMLAFAAAAYAQPPQETPRPPADHGAPAGAQGKDDKKPPAPEEKTSQTKHTIQIGGEQIKYTATAGTMLLKKEDGTPTASIFYIAYIKDGVPDETRRPLTFAFNGGPGSSSVWLQLGALGPKRVMMDEQGSPLPPPYKLVDNECSILDVTDLVFIDPVSTGFSRAIPEQDAKNFHGIMGDIDSVADFIRLYLTRSSRWTSPKFLAGESYGTTRAAALSGNLQTERGIALNGIMLLSTVLNFETISFDRGNDLPYILFLPTYTATAWFHKKLPSDLMASQQKAIEESQQFSSHEYTLALMKGDTITAPERAEVVAKLARLTGLSKTFVDESNMRVPISHFTKELLRDDRRTVGRYDSRLEGIDLDPTAASPEYDPSYASVFAPFTAAWNQYVRTELKWDSDLPYEVLTSRVRPWSWGEFQNRYVNVSDSLRAAMTQNRDLKVFVANGYYDLATPFFATEYTFSHLGLDPVLQGHVTMDFFEAGHMMYTHRPSLERVKADLAKFITGAVP